MSKEYVFWIQVIPKYSLAYPWNRIKQLVKVTVRDSNISSDGPVKANSQVGLDIPLANIAQIQMVISNTAPSGSVEIITQEQVRYELVPTNPLDPTLWSYNNVHEIKSFIQVVQDLKANRTSDVDENPYIRQFSQKYNPSYLDYKIVRHWDKNISPWEYYYQFVPESVDKKKRIAAKITEIIVTICAIIAAIFTLYVGYTEFIK